jgi:hypothetical protein
MLASSIATTAGLIPIPQLVYHFKLSYLAVPLWGLAMTCVKVSIALTILRIRQGLVWKIFVYFIIAVQAAYGIGNVFFDLLECQPLAAAWDFTMVDGKCLPSSAILIASNTGSGINIATDFLLSLSPLTFLHKLARPLPEKILICLLMGMGVFASICSIMKTIIVQGFADPNQDILATGVAITTWTVLEELVAVLAACAPALGGTIRRCLGYMGISLTTVKPGTYGGAYGSKRTNTSQGIRIQSSTLVESHSVRNLQDDEEFMLGWVRHGQNTKSAEAGSTCSATTPN